MIKPDSIHSGGSNGVRTSHDGTADLFCDMVSIPAFVYNFAEDRYLWLAKCLEAFVDREKCISQGLSAWAGRIHPEDFPAFYHDHFTELKKLTQLKKGKTLPLLKTISFRVANKERQWIPAIVRADVVGYDSSGHPSCIFGLLLTNEAPSNEVIEANGVTTANGNAPPAQTKGNITTRELEVLNLLRRGQSSREISEGLAISFHTVESYRKRLLQKFNVRNTPELIAKAGTRYVI